MPFSASTTSVIAMALKLANGISCSLERSGDSLPYNRHQACWGSTGHDAEASSPCLSSAILGVKEDPSLPLHRWSARIFVQPSLLTLDDLLIVSLFFTTPLNVVALPHYRSFVVFHALSSCSLRLFIVEEGWFPLMSMTACDCICILLCSEHPFPLLRAFLFSIHGSILVVALYFSDVFIVCDCSLAWLASCLFGYKNIQLIAHLPIHHPTHSSIPTTPPFGQL
jgi:hypothetical protein